MIFFIFPMGVPAGWVLGGLNQSARLHNKYSWSLKFISSRNFPTHTAQIYQCVNLVFVIPIPFAATYMQLRYGLWGNKNCLSSKPNPVRCCFSMGWWWWWWLKWHNQINKMICGLKYIGEKLIYCYISLWLINANYCILKKIQTKLLAQKCLHTANAGQHFVQGSKVWAQFDLVTSKTTASTRQIDFYAFSRDTEVGHPI